MIELLRPLRKPASARIARILPMIVAPTLGFDHIGGSRRADPLDPVRWAFAGTFPIGSHGNARKQQPADKNRPKDMERHGQDDSPFATRNGRRLADCARRLESVLNPRPADAAQAAVHAP